MDIEELSEKFDDKMAEMRTYPEGVLIYGKKSSDVPPEVARH